MGSLVIVRLHIFCWVCQWKKIENQTVFNKDMAKSFVAWFFPTNIVVYMCLCDIVESGEKAMEDLLVCTVWRPTRLLSQEGWRFTCRRNNAAWCFSRISCASIQASKGGIYFVTKVWFFLSVLFLLFTNPVHYFNLLMGNF